MPAKAQGAARPETTIGPAGLRSSRVDGDPRPHVAGILRGERGLLDVLLLRVDELLEAVEDAFGMDIDYAMLIKVYGADVESERRYSPVVCQSCTVRPMQGDPDPKRISTSYIERQNLTMRMSMRRYTRLTNGFSKKLENHAAATAIHFLYYNFARIHRTIRMSPAMKAGVTDRLWSIRDIVGLLEEHEAREAA